jgi:hypothetical protein
MASFMPGEWDWMNGGNAGSVGGGLLGNPYLQMGLGILANNQGNYGALGPALGRGMSQGLQNVQASKQFDQQSKLYQLKLAEAEREQKRYQDEQDAIAKAIEKNPELEHLFRIDPKAAIQATNPTLNTADPYFSDRYIGGKVYSYNHRTGEYIEKNLGGSSLPNKDDPTIQGNVAGAKAEAGAAWKPNTDIDGVLTTDAQVVRGAYGNQPIPFSGLPQQAPQVSPQAPQNGLPSNNFNTPYPVTFGAPGTTATDRAEGVTGPNSINVGNPARPNPGGGIRVPTAAEKAAAAEAAKLEAEAAANARIGLGQAVSQAETTLRLVDELVGSEDGRIPEHPGFRAAVGASSTWDPRNYLAGTEATGFNTRLDQLKGQQFLQAFESLKGGGQITEVEGKKATDAIARMNTATTEDEFIKGAREFQSIIRAGMERAKKKAGGSQQIIPSGAAGGTVNQPRKPMKGQTVDGYKFKGGDPADPANWERK